MLDRSLFRHSSLCPTIMRDISDLSHSVLKNIQIALRKWSTVRKAKILITDQSHRKSRLLSTSGFLNVFLLCPKWWQHPLCTQLKWHTTDAKAKSLKVCLHLHCWKYSNSKDTWNFVLFTSNFLLIDQNDDSISFCRNIVLTSYTSPTN